MRKIFLIICIISLTGFYQINLYCQGITYEPEIANSYENTISQSDCRLQADGIQILSPQDGDVLKGLVTIEWVYLFPYNLADVILSNVYYSSDSGKNWVQIAFETPNYYFEWDTTLYVKYGATYKVSITSMSKNWTEDLQVANEGTFTIDNRIEPSFRWFLYLGIPLLVILIGSVIGFVTYKFKPKKQNSFDFLQEDQTEKIKVLNQKVIIGLDNIKDSTNWISEISSTSTGTRPLENGSIAKYFPDSIHKELKSEIKGRTVMVLIEIAYQNPSETNPIKIAEGVGIPPSTLSKEINKLITLNYIEQHVSSQVLLDARYRNFRITKKGFEFLNILNVILKDTIQKIKIRNENNSL
ncbi:MAG: winged helix-turn-helix transcriptional regulator [Asgard group archaeon]|nr:winged helix-turn-helix transcriptional regulator [Asgard group archaeon]